MSNTSPNFASLLDEAPTEISRPKPLPIGTYLCTVKDYETGASRQKQTPFVRFNLLPIAALEDVDEDDLALAGGCDGKALRLDIWVTSDAVYRLDEFHTHCGIELEEGVSRSARNDLCVNQQVLAVVAHRVDEKDPERIYTDVARTAIAE